MVLLFSASGLQSFPELRSFTLSCAFSDSLWACLGTTERVSACFRSRTSRCCMLPVPQNPQNVLLHVSGAKERASACFWSHGTGFCIQSSSATRHTSACVQHHRMRASSCFCSYKIRFCMLPDPQNALLNAS